MKNLIRNLLFCGVLAAICIMTSGCAYMSNRGNDALDIFDVGLTVTKTPHIGAYAGFNSILGLGYSEMTGTLIGIGQRQVGVLDMRYEAAAMTADGYEYFAFGKNVGTDMAVDHGVGFGMIEYGTPKTVIQALQCAKQVHLLWIGVNLTCKLGEIGDFIVGWTTLDIANDDEYGAEKSAQ